MKRSMSASFAVKTFAVQVKNTKDAKEKKAIYAWYSSNQPEMSYELYSHRTHLEELCAALCYQVTDLVKENPMTTIRDVSTLITISNGQKKYIYMYNGPFFNLTERFKENFVDPIVNTIVHNYKNEYEKITLRFIRLDRSEQIYNLFVSNMIHQKVKVYLTNGTVSNKYVDQPMWNYWSIIDPETIADLGFNRIYYPDNAVCYLDHAGNLTFIDFNNKRFMNKTLNSFNLVETEKEFIFNY